MSDEKSQTQDPDYDPALDPQSPQFDPERVEMGALNRMLARRAARRAAITPQGEGQSPQPPA